MGAIKLNPALDLLHLFATPILPAFVAVVVAETLTLLRGKKTSNAVIGCLTGFAVGLLHVWFAWTQLWHGEAFFIFVLAEIAALPVLGVAAVIEVVRQR